MNCHIVWFVYLFSIRLLYKRNVIVRKIGGEWGSSFVWSSSCISDSDRSVFVTWYTSINIDHIKLMIDSIYLKYITFDGVYSVEDILNQLLKCLLFISLIPRTPDPTGERQSGTVVSTSWSKRQTSFPLKKYILYNECPF